MRSTRRLTSLTLTSLSSTLAILATVAATTPAAAQNAQALPNRNFEADLFQPAIGPRNFLTLDAPEVPIHKQLSVGAFYDYQVDPYRISYTTLRANSIADEHVSHVVANQHKLELQGSIGLLDRFQVGLALPVTLVLNGEEVSGQRRQRRRQPVLCHGPRRPPHRGEGRADHLWCGRPAGAGRPAGGNRSHRKGRRLPEERRPDRSGQAAWRLCNWAASASVARSARCCARPSPPWMPRWAASFCTAAPRWCAC